MNHVLDLSTLFQAYGSMRLPLNNFRAFTYKSVFRKDFLAGLPTLFQIKHTSKVKN